MSSLPELWAAHAPAIPGLALRAGLRNTSAATMDPVDFYGIDDTGRAIINVVGALFKYAAAPDDPAASLHEIRSIVRGLADDPDVTSIALHIDSPGGPLAGVSDTAYEVARAARLKPVSAFVSDLCVGSAYWLACMARDVVVNPTGILGGIGVMMVVRDTSESAAKAGVRVVVVKAGAFKGAGVAGAEVTQSQIAEWERSVEALNSQFVRAVAKGRRLGVARAKALADGRVHIGRDAIALGLADRVGVLEDEIAQTNGHDDDERELAMSKRTDRAPTTSAGDGRDPIADFNERLRERMRDGLSRSDAVRAVCKADPKLHKAYLEACNPGKVVAR